MGTDATATDTGRFTDVAQFDLSPTADAYTLRRKSDNIRAIFSSLMRPAVSADMPSCILSQDEFKAVRATISPVARRLDSESIQVAQALSQAAEVASIFVSKYKNEVKYLVFLNTAEYEPALMDRLLGIEYDLHQALDRDDHFLSFSYVHKGASSPEPELLYAGSVCAFRR